tara:strand:+ start:1163 stop:2059 length:897 start_codon:yes stop_codon:yes gene_type:complete
MATLFRHTSLTKGVSFDKASKRWIGKFTINGQRHYIGSFKEEADAAQAVNRARINIANSYYLRNEVKDLLEEEKSQINTNAPNMSGIQAWDTLPLRQIKEIATKHGITGSDLIADARTKQAWIDVLNNREIRPMTAKEPEIAAAVDEIDDLIAYLDQDEKEDREYSDQAALDLPEEEWTPCVVINPDEPSYYWCHDGFLYTLYPTEGYTVWRYDEAVTGNYKPIGVWIGPEMDEDEDHLEPQWEVAIDKDAGTYCKIGKPEEPEEGEILENWHEDAVMSSPLSDHRNHSFAKGKTAKR